jgi:hypothetical protein
MQLRIYKKCDPLLIVAIVQRAQYTESFARGPQRPEILYTRFRNHLISIIDFVISDRFPDFSQTADF